MTTTEAKSKACPMLRSSLCEASRCMAWQSTSQNEGFCLMVSRSRTVFIAPTSASLSVEVQEGLQLKTNRPLEVRVVQGEFDCLDVHLKA